MNTERILISDLRIRCIIGVEAEERRKKQDVVINLAVNADLTKVCKSDRFEDTVDYRAMKKRIVTMVENSQFFLVEALAEAVAQICLEHPLVTRVVARVEKPAALRFARTVGIEVTREKMTGNVK